MSSVRRCRDDGFLVATDGWLPEAPFDWHWPPLAPRIGCNSLRCSTCGQVVRQAAGYAGPGTLPPAAVYEFLGGGTPTGGDPPPRHPEGRGRLYSCTCYTAHVFSTHGVHEPFDPISEETTPWACAGHPPLGLPAQLDGMALDSHTDWLVLAREVFSGARNPPVDPAVKEVQGFWIARLYNLLEPPATGALAHAVSTMLLDPEPRVRVTAIRFFQLNDDAPGADRLAAAARDHSELFVGVRDPDSATLTLWDWLIEALDWRMRADPLALKEVQAGALRPPGIARVIYSLAWQHPDWVLDHGAAILAAAPRDWPSLLNAVKGADLDRVVALACSVLSGGYALPDELTGFAESHLEDPLRERVVSETNAQRQRS